MTDQPPQPPPHWTAAPPPGWGAPPPGWAATPYAGSPFVPLRGLATALTVLLAADAIFSVLSAGAYAYRTSVIGDYPGSATVSDLEDADALVAGAVTLVALVSIAVIVVWIIWQHRHARNAEFLAGSLPLGPGWAIGGWFIPLANLVLGPLQLAQSAAASDPRLGVGGDAQARRGRVPGVLVAWWIVFATGNVLSVIGNLSTPDEAASSLDEFQTADRISAVAALVTAAAAVLAVLTVRVVTERQESAIERRLRTPMPPMPPPSDPAV